MSAHTPGPWRLVTRGRNRKTALRAADDRWLATFDQMTQPREEMEANARLIAAAPDLLKACELALSTSDPSVLGVLREAVALARGGR